MAKNHTRLNKDIPHERLKRLTHYASPPSPQLPGSRLLAGLRLAISPPPPLFPGSLRAFNPRISPLPLFFPGSMRAFGPQFPPLPHFFPPPSKPSARKFSPSPSFSRLPVGLQPAISPPPLISPGSMRAFGPQILPLPLFSPAPSGPSARDFPHSPPSPSFLPSP